MYRSIELNVKIGCPVACVYCPQDKFTKSNFETKKILSKEDLKIIIDNLTYKEKKAEIFFAGMSEPFSHKECVDFIKYCNNHKNITKVVIFTTGYNLTEDHIESLKNLKKIKMNFHIGNKTYMPNFDEKIWNKLNKIKESISNCEFINVGFEKDNDLIKKLKEIGISLKFQEIISRSGNLISVGDKILDQNFTNHAVTCPKVSYEKRPVILPDGTALICANDYSCELKIGNLLRQKWEDLDFKKIENLQKRPDPSVPCFKNCHCATIIKTKPKIL